MLAAALLCVIELLGVSGGELRSRAFFDANNVKVGDPLVLTVDFIGDADFRALHPPALSKAVDRADWKVDDASAKTDTFRDARRLTYRVRPMRAGLLVFPALEFAYSSADGTPRRVRANEIPVHAKPGADVVVAGMDEMSAAESMPSPPDLVLDPGVPLSGDRLFAWRKACAEPTEGGFSAFDFPAARMNGASCAIRSGNWAAALKAYSALEWRIGQTPEIERGMVAALALRHGNPRAELPMWRQALRPVLRFGWKGRLVAVVGSIVALSAFFWLVGRGIRALACAATVLLLALPIRADVFDMMEEQIRRMQQAMSFRIGGGDGVTPKISAALSVDRRRPRVGEPFSFVVSLEAPKSVSFEQIRLEPSVEFGFQSIGDPSNLADAPAANPSNVVKRISVPVRYDAPIKTPMSFRVSGMVTGVESRGGGRVSVRFSRSFECETPPVELSVSPLDGDGQPADFGGIVSDGLRVVELCDILRVETNDVVTISYRLTANGYVPDGYLIPGSAFEWSRKADRGGRTSEVEYRRYFVADGAETTPVVSVPYYDPRTKEYRRASAGGTRLVYVQQPPD